MTIKQGDIYWLELDQQISHPHVVIQDYKLNDSLDTVIVCALTTNRKKISMPGNVLLDIGEGNLEKQSIVEVYKVLTVNKSQLKDYVGTLSQDRVKEILAGMQFIEKSFLRS